MKRLKWIVAAVTIMAATFAWVLTVRVDCIDHPPVKAGGILIEGCTR